MAAINQVEDRGEDRGMEEHDESGSTAERIERLTSASKQRGFASMDQDRQREIASAGGKAAHQKGTAHEFSAEEARAAGRKGGEAVSRNREHMVAIGRKGGLKRSANYARNAESEGGQTDAKIAVDSKTSETKAVEPKNENVRRSGTDPRLAAGGGR